MSVKNFKTEQETFWAGEFGDDYISRNEGAELLATNLNLFSNALKQVRKVNSILEFGANIGMNLKALKLLFPKMGLKGIEINPKAAAELANTIGESNVVNDSIFNVDNQLSADLTLIKGVLIHINPDELKTVYQKLYDCSNNYILVAEYYNPSPVTISYRGHTDRLFKRDFAGELLDLYSDLELVDYGFIYKRDPNFPQDDITWFLLQKK